MSPATAERLECLAEELAEAIQMVCKSLRHGLESSHRDYGNEENTALLAKELGDVEAWIELLAAHGEISGRAVTNAKHAKLAKVSRGTHFHHQQRQGVTPEQP